jgi:hypothetical protein
MSYVTAESRVEWLPHGRAFTRSDLDAMPEDGNRYELIDGALIVTPAPSMRHQITVVSLLLRGSLLCAHRTSDCSSRLSMSILLRTRWSNRMC